MADTFSIPVGIPTTIISAATTTGAGSTYAVPSRVQGLPGAGLAVGWAATFATLGGAPAEVYLEGSLDATNWFQLDTTGATIVNTLQFVAAKPCNFLRANVHTLPAGGTATVVVSI